MQLPPRKSFLNKIIIRLSKRHRTHCYCYGTEHLFLLYLNFICSEMRMAQLTRTHSVVPDIACCSVIINLWINDWTIWNWEITFNYFKLRSFIFPVVFKPPHCNRKATPTIIFSCFSLSINWYPRLLIIITYPHNW